MTRAVTTRAERGDYVGEPIEKDHWIKAVNQRINLSLRKKSVAGLGRSDADGLAHPTASVKLLNTLDIHGFYSDTSRSGVGEV